MKTLPYGGGTFAETRVSEPGRQFVIRLLNQLTDAQVEDLFSGARFDPVSEWARVFRLRQKQISDGPACPDA